MTVDRVSDVTAPVRGRFQRVVEVVVRRLLTSVSAPAAVNGDDVRVNMVVMATTTLDCHCVPTAAAWPFVLLVPLVFVISDVIIVAQLCWTSGRRVYAAAFERRG